MIKKRPLINHNYICCNCDNPATISIEERYHKYEIDNYGDFDEVDDWGADNEELWCDDCYDEKYN